MIYRASVSIFIRTADAGDIAAAEPGRASRLTLRRRHFSPHAEPFQKELPFH